MLFLHAGVTDQRSWHHVVDRLAPEARCVTYDRRGYGKTTYEAEPGWSPVGDAVAVLDASGIERAILVAASMGGRTALDLTLEHPDRVAGLVLVGSAVRGGPDVVLDEPVQRLDEQLEAAYARKDLEEANRLEAHVWLDGPLVPEGRVQGEARELFLDMNAIALSSADPGEEADQPGAWSRVGQIAVPTLVLVGEHDLRHVRDNAQHLAHEIPGARLVDLPGVAHLPHLEGDPTTLEAIAGFLADF